MKKIAILLLVLLTCACGDDDECPDGTVTEYDCRDLPGGTQRCDPVCVVPANPNGALF